MPRHSNHGRPKADPSKLKRHNLTVRLSDEDLLALHEKSKRVNLPYSEFLREAGLSRKLPRPIPEVNWKCHQELSRIGNNLNQAIKLVYEGRCTTIQEGILIELQQAVLAARQELKGQ